MADGASISASKSDKGKDPVFLVMVTGQIESAEVCCMHVLYNPFIDMFIDMV